MLLYHIIYPNDDLTIFLDYIIYLVLSYDFYYCEFDIEYYIIAKIEKITEK